jgi:lipopolysaccharide/colanic/teichoic acid biosynthesis glycosyltransferase
LKGEMSLVGPRPEMPQIVAEYEPWQRERLKVKPGITGIWQILGRKDLPLEKNIQYDLIYVKNRSFLLDIIIILKTIPLVIKGKGAY